MEININNSAAPQRLAFVAPTLGGARGEVCPKSGFRRTDAHTQAFSPVVDDDAMATGHRPWRHLIS
jgi:hypothetical protein